LILPLLAPRVQSARWHESEGDHGQPLCFSTFLMSVSGGGFTGASNSLQRDANLSRPLLHRPAIGGNVDCVGCAASRMTVGAANSPSTAS
jgi:hypothetical protein